MRRRQVWLPLTILALSLHLAGSSDAWAQWYSYRSHYSSSYRSWPGDYTFKRQRTPKSDSTKKTRSQEAAKESSKSASKEVAKGPLLVIISIADQRISVYDNGALLAHSSVSTGVKGHPTPLGVFSVISKSKFHRSNIYSNAPMPFMQRITWSGIALHAGDLPGYPASHGCIRLKHDFAVQLFHLTKRGTRVIIAQDDIRPSEISNPQLFVPQPKLALASPPAVPAGQSPSGTVTADATEVSLSANAKQQGGAKAPDPAPGAAAPQKGAAITVFVSRKLGKLFVRQGFAPLFDVPVKIQDPAEPMGTHVFTAMDFQNDGAAIRWTVVTVPERSSAAQKAAAKPHKGRVKETIKTVSPTPNSANAALKRIEIPQNAAERIAQLLTPGSSLIISDYGISDETGADTDFIVLTR